MSASILYKFRASATFEALPLPGTAARLFDVKKAIVMAKNLDDGGSMEFDLSVRDATTNEEYSDENMLLPRGTRLIVQRLPAARGHGFLSRMARNPHGGAGPPGSAAPSNNAAPSNFYTIDSRVNADEEEFVSTAATSTAAADEDTELAALRAATDAGRGDLRLHVSGGAGGAGGFRPPPRGNNSNSNFVPRQRPNADPELREQEKQAMPKKRATGIPRTFLNLNAPPSTDGAGEGEGNVPLLQPNAIGFEELKSRGGGQSGSASNSKSLEYALKLTATTIPEYLQCAICQNVVKDAMILPWDAEGRTTCESCIRDALTQNGFRCPLTGQEGVSPDDLVANNALRKAADQFVKGVLEKMEEITKQQVDDDEDMDLYQGDSGKGGLLDGDNADKGVIVSKKTTLTSRKKQEEDDPFAGEDDFGGDVFAVDTEEKAEEKQQPSPEPVKQEEEPVKKEEPSEPKVEIKKEEPPNDTKIKTESSVPVASASNPDTSHNIHRERSRSPVNNRGREPAREPSSSRRDRRRGPPVGYSMGPAGGAALGPRETPREESFSPRNEPRREGHDGRDDRGRNFGGRGRGGGRGHGRNDRSYSREDDRHSRDGGDGESIGNRHDRGAKRSRSGSDYDESAPDSRYRRYNDRPPNDRPHGRYDDRPPNDRPYNDRYDDRRGRGGRGGYGRFDDRGCGRGGRHDGGRGYYGGRRGRGRGRY